MPNFKTLRSINIAAACLGAMALGGSQALAQIVHANNVTIHNSLCVGFDCANSESYGADTIRLKENNLRIHFLDTSAGNFPSTDWRLIANSNANGGANFFVINDATANRDIFTVSGGAPSNSLFIHSSGRVGLSTSTPSVELHIRNGDTSTVRLEQDGSSGFAPQSWDVAGNETSFFIRDVTNGSTLPFRIRPGAPSQSLTINAEGNVGVGTINAQDAIHATGVGNTSLRIQTTGTAAAIWSVGTNSSTGLFYVKDIVADTFPLRIRAGAPSNALELRANGAVRMAGLTDCAGIQTNASGILSCAPAPSPPPAGFAGSTSAVAAAGTSASRASASSAGSARSGSANGSSAEASGNGTSDTCSAGDMAGGWSLIGTNIEKFGANSVLWCDVQLTQAQGKQIRYSISGNCRNHAPNASTPEAFTIVGKGSITETATCRIGGSFRIKQGSSVVTTASIVEGRIEGPASKKTRAVALSRLPRGRTSALQTFILQR